MNHQRKEYYHHKDIRYIQESHKLFFLGYGNNHQHYYISYKCPHHISKQRHPDIQYFVYSHKHYSPSKSDLMNHQRKGNYSQICILRIQYQQHSIVSLVNAHSQPDHCILYKYPKGIERLMHQDNHWDSDTQRSQRRLGKIFYL